MLGCEEGVEVGPQDEHGRQGNRVGRRRELHAEQGDEPEETDQARAGPARHVRLGAGEGRGGCEGDADGVEGQSFRDICHRESDSSVIHTAGVTAVCPHEGDQQGDREQEGGGMKDEEEMLCSRRCSASV